MILYACQSNTHTHLLFVIFKKKEERKEGMERGSEVEKEGGREGRWKRGGKKETKIEGEKEKSEACDLNVLS